MKVKTGISVGMLALLMAPSACSLINKPCPDPMSCACPTSPNPACAPWPRDAKNPDGGSSR